MKTRDVIHQETWNPDNPFIEIEETVITEQEKELLRYFVTDIEGNELEEYKTGEKIILNIETRNRIGDSITIHLNDKTHDFKYGGQTLENDKLSNYVINKDLEQIELDVINQE